MLKFKSVIIDIISRVGGAAPLLADEILAFLEDARLIHSALIHQKMQVAVEIYAVSKGLDDSDNAGLKAISPFARVARRVDKLFQRLEIEPEIQEFLPQEVKFLGKKVCDSGVGSGKEHLPVIE